SRVSCGSGISRYHPLHPLLHPVLSEWPRAIAAPLAVSTTTVFEERPSCPPAILHPLHPPTSPLHPLHPATRPSRDPTSPSSTTRPACGQRRSGGSCTTSGSGTTPTVRRRSSSNRRTHFTPDASRPKPPRATR